MTERVEARHQRILRLVRERGAVRVTELADELGISKETVRRDVVALVDIGRLRRVHGKVCWPTAVLNARDARLARREGRSAAGPVIGMIVPTPGHLYHNIIRGARSAASAAGARLLVAVAEQQHDREPAPLRTLLAAGADGVLYTPSWEPDGDVDQLATLTMPVVIVERELPPGTPAALLDWVCSDHANGAAQAIGHLAKMGHRRVALLARHSPISSQIRVGYRAAATAVGLPDDDLGAQSPHGVSGNSAAFDDEIDRLVALARSGEVHAALVHDESDAVMVDYRLAAAGLRVPEDVALISYGDELPTVTNLALTAVAPAAHAVGEAAVHLLLRRLADPSSERSHLTVLPELKVRTSCGYTSS